MPAALAALAAIAAPVGCQSGAPALRESTAGSRDGADAPSRAATGASRDFLAQDDGLEVRRWTIFDRGDKLAAVLAGFDCSSALDDATRAQLQVNGLRLFRVDRAALDSLIEALGGAIVDVSAWHGQAHDWREIQAADYDGGAALAVDGRVMTLADGELQLLVRGWTLMMEDGPHVHLESKTRLIRTPPVDYRQLLTQRTDEQRSRYFASLAFDLRLDGGRAYVIASEDPAKPWRVAGYEATLESTSSASASGLRSGQPARGPLPDVGPRASSPPTIGQALFGSMSQFVTEGDEVETGAHSVTRDILILIPHISHELFPPLRAEAAGPDA